MSAEYWGRPARRSSLPDLDARCQLPDLITICRARRRRRTMPTSRPRCTPPMSRPYISDLVYYISRRARGHDDADDRGHTRGLVLFMMSTS